MKEPLYIIERHEHGWLVKPAPSKTGIPLVAMHELAPMFGKQAVIDPGIANATRSTLAVGTKEDCEKWRVELEQWLETRVSNPLDRWREGTDTGTSSLSIFHLLAERTPDDFRADVPYDSGDFGRCLRLVNRFNWRDKLNQVAEAYKDTAWPAIIARWDEIAAATTKEQTRILKEINELHRQNRPH